MYLTAKEVRQLYKICDQTLYNWRRLNKIKYKKLPSGSYVYYPIEDTPELYDSQTIIFGDSTAFESASNYRVITDERELLKSIVEGKTKMIYTIEKGNVWRWLEVVCEMFGVEIKESIAVKSYE